MAVTFGVGQHSVHVKHEGREGYFPQRFK
jgi:hypothetical protein